METVASLRVAITASERPFAKSDAAGSHLLFCSKLLPAKSSCRCWTAAGFPTTCESVAIRRARQSLL